MTSTNQLKQISVSFEDGFWKKKAKEISTNVLARYAEEVDEQGRFPIESLQALAEARLLSIGIPKEKGGQGGDVKTMCAIVEELAQGCASSAMVFLMHSSTMPLIGRLVSEDQYENILLPIIEGNGLGSYSMSERGSGTRLWHMDSCAVDKGDHFDIDSFKSFATSSGHSDFYLLPVRSSETSAPNELSLFFVNGKDPDINIIGKWNGMGLRGNCSTPVHFNHVKVPKENRLGPANIGFNFLMAYTFPPYILGLAAVYLGIARAAFEGARRHVCGRNFTDTQNSLVQVETIQRYMAEMKIAIEKVKHSLDRTAGLTAHLTKVFDELHAADMLDELLEKAQDDSFFMELAQLKVAACEMAIEVSNKAVQVCGGMGYKRGHVVERAYRDARAGSLMGPSDDILKVLIGKNLLGLKLPWK
ncbi:acyl-CoA dehydrogenase family protein [Paraflavisolibacter sp. H34]|uniref:acyl-CoA dehydrogenase family protein n=1 Tax=Huijunlia imazamoxiresistens TaxID=3127457 RepID=UPI003018DE11